MFVIRDAAIADAKHILEIYDYYVKNTAITFDYDTTIFHILSNCLKPA